jgi:hypothetical protein
MIKPYQLDDGSIRSDSRTELTPDLFCKGCGSDVLVALYEVQQRVGHAGVLRPTWRRGM